MAMASTAFASPALARDDSWYVELDGGPMIVEDIDFNVAGTPEGVTADTHTGYDFGGVVGYDFGAVRLEAEGSYRSADMRQLFVAPIGIPAGGAALSHGVLPANGDANVLSFMVNGLLDFGDDDGLQGFVGGGVGIGRTDINATATATGPNFVNDSDSGFAWQLLAGIRAPINDHWDVGLKYRMFQQDNIDLVDSLGRDTQAHWRSHSLLGTISYNFGGPVAPPPVVAPPPAPVPLPPPPPPPAPVMQCNKGPYIVFFEWDKSDITPEAATILDNAVSAYANCGSAAVMLAGHTDRSGTEAYNMGLAARRNTSVRTYLTGHGIPDTRITSQAFGETMPRVPTADGVRELQNRRVEITYGPGSGM
jgi:outer membrane protein OmpA-like peptidoglycan-associated protein